MTPSIPSLDSDAGPDTRQAVDFNWRGACEDLGFSAAALSDRSPEDALSDLEDIEGRVRQIKAHLSGRPSPYNLRDWRECLDAAHEALTVAQRAYDDDGAKEHVRREQAIALAGKYLMMSLERLP